MADVVFTPTFHHTPWIDNRDRVQAGGLNGFNVRLTAVETDFQSVSTVVAQVNTALHALGQTPGATTHTLTVSPALVVISGSSAWSHDSNGFAVRTGAFTSLAGLMSVNMPDGATLVSLRALGQNNGAGALRVNLFRSQLLAVPAPAERLARVTGDTNPFDNTSAVDPGLAAVDTSQYRYFLTVTLDNATTADIVSLSGFQIIYTAV
jgi:hypothetical protein